MRGYYVHTPWLTRRRACMLLDVAVLLSLCFFLLYLRSHPLTSHYDVDRSKYPVKGVDLSAHNGDVDFLRLAADTVSFVLLKATEGTDFCDARFADNYRRARAAGLKVGAYHFYRFDTPGDVQAQHFIESVAGRQLDFPLIIDVEKWGNPASFNDYEVRSNLRRLLAVLAATGYPIMVYTNKKGYSSYIEGEFDYLPLWLCSLSAPPKPDWQLWQHSHKGAVDGVDGFVDINTFNGSERAFQRWAQPFTVDSDIAVQ